MSISVDDLVASFNSSHIGQEQMDLAALQVRRSIVLANVARSDITTGAACTGPFPSATCYFAEHEWPP